MNKKYFIDLNGKPYIGEHSNGIWRFESTDYTDRFMTTEIKGKTMKEVTFDDWIKAQQKQGA